MNTHAVDYDPNSVSGSDLTGRQAARVLLLILALALSLRIYHVHAAVIISPDSAVFISYAQGLCEDPLAAAKEFAGRQHPLYPALIGLLHAPISAFAGDGAAGWILAGRAGAILGSLGAILAMYWLTTRLTDRRRALVAAAMLAILPDACRVGADVLSDLPHLALYLTGLAALLAGMQTGRARFVVLCALAAGLAFLTRPEGASVLVVGLAVVLSQQQWKLKRRVGLAAAMLLVFAAVAAPYQMATGKLIPKKSPLELFKFNIDKQASTNPDQKAGWAGQTREDSVAVPTRVAHAAMPVPLNVLRQWLRAGRVVYIVLAIVGLIVARPRGVGGRLLAVAIGVHVLLLHALEMRYGYLDRRHALILAALSLPVAADGVWWLATRLGGARSTTTGSPRTLAVAGILAACALATSPWLLRPINGEDQYVADAVRWLSENTEPSDRVITDDRLHRAALCADREFVRWPWWDGGAGDLDKFLSDQPPSYFAVDTLHITQRNPAFFDELEQRLGDRMKLVSAEETVGSEHPPAIRIYRFSPPKP